MSLPPVVSRDEWLVARKELLVRIHEFPPTSRDGEEPPAAVATAMRQSSAIAIVTRYSLSHTQARMAATRAGARVASMPGITVDIFARTIPIDYTHLESDASSRES